MTTTLSSPKSVVITLAAGSWIMVSGTGTYTRVVGLGGGQSIGFQGSARIGPFDTAQTINLCAATTDLTYYVDSAPSGNRQVLLDSASGLVTDSAASNAVVSVARSIAQHVPYIPVVMASPPTTAVTSSLGTNTMPASAIQDADGNVVGQDIAAWDPRLLWLGAPWKRYNGNNLITTGQYPSALAKGTSFCEFDLRSFDGTGRFEINYHGNSTSSTHGVRVLVWSTTKRQWEYVTQGVTFASSTANLSDCYKGLVTLGAAGLYGIRFECSSGFTLTGITVGPDDIVTPRPRPLKRAFESGNSYTAETVIDTGTVFPAGDCFPALLCYQTGWDIVPCGIGGADYTVDNGANTHTSAHLPADLAAALPVDVVIPTHGTNDISSASTAAAVGVEATMVRSQIATVVPNVEVISTSPMWYRSLLETSNSKALSIRDAIKAAYAADKWIDLMESSPASYLGPWSETVPLGGLSIGATSVTLSTVPPAIEAIIAAGSVGVARNDWYIRIGTGDNQEIRRVTACSTGKTLTIGALTFAHVAGEPIVLSGPSYITGIGSQIKFTGSLSSANSGTLTATWQGPTGTYTITFSTGARRSGTFTNGSTSVTWTGAAITATALASACSISQGNAGRIIGNDQVHPTRDGHVQIAQWIAAGLRKAYAVA
jgi:lysophospholipase L1-like esterase